MYPHHATAVRVRVKPLSLQSSSNSNTHSNSTISPYMIDKNKQPTNFHIPASVLHHSPPLKRISSTSSSASTSASSVLQSNLNTSDSNHLNSSINQSNASNADSTVRNGSGAASHPSKLSRVSPAPRASHLSMNPPDNAMMPRNMITPHMGNGTTKGVMSAHHHMNMNMQRQIPVAASHTVLSPHKNTNQPSASPSTVLNPYMRQPSMGISPVKASNDPSLSAYNNTNVGVQQKSNSPQRHAAVHSPAPFPAPVRRGSFSQPSSITSSITSTSPIRKASVSNISNPDISSMAPSSTARTTMGMGGVATADPLSSLRRMLDSMNIQPTQQVQGRRPSFSNLSNDAVRSTSSVEHAQQLKRQLQQHETIRSMSSSSHTSQSQTSSPQPSLRTTTHTNGHAGAHMPSTLPRLPSVPRFLPSPTYSLSHAHPHAAYSTHTHTPEAGTATHSNNQSPMLQRQISQSSSSSTALHSPTLSRQISIQACNSSMTPTITAPQVTDNASEYQKPTTTPPSPSYTSSIDQLRRQQSSPSQQRALRTMTHLRSGSAENAGKNSRRLSGVDDIAIFNEQRPTSDNAPISAGVLSLNRTHSALTSSAPEATSDSWSTEFADQNENRNEKHVSLSSSNLQFPPRRLIGLTNLGNTCFMNSTLQCLYTIPHLLSYFAHPSIYQRDLNTTVRSNGLISKNFGQLAEKMVKSPDYSVDRSAVSDLKRAVAKLNPQFSGFEQHDTEEFLRYLLDGLHDEVNRIKQKPKYEEIKDNKNDSDLVKSQRWWDNYTSRNNSIITDIFSGQFRSTVQCMKCKHISVTFDPFQSVSVPVAASSSKGARLSSFISSSSSTTCTLDDCITAFNKSELLTDHEQVYCSQCKTHRDSRKQMTIVRFPQTLVMHLKRFDYNEHGRTKIDTNVTYPLSLDLSWLIPDNCRVRQPKPVYELVAVNLHLGTADSGHYIAYGKANNEFYCFNDSTITNLKASQLASPNAYVLFYQRVDSITYDAEHSHSIVG